MTRGTDEATVRRHVIFHGHVQGVCFRAVSLELSRGFQVMGYVRNLPDGTVELEAEGVQDQVDDLLAAIEREFAANLRDVEKRSIPTRGDEDAFRITY